MSMQFGDLQIMLQQYMTPILVFGGIGFALWMILVFRALQAHNESEVGQIDRYVKERSRGHS
jgi:uncharacterized membrane protein